MECDHRSSSELPLDCNNVRNGSSGWPVIKDVVMVGKLVLVCAVKEGNSPRRKHTASRVWPAATVVY